MHANRARAMALALALVLPALALAERPPVAHVWIDGEDVDGPPPSPPHEPGHVAASLWPGALSTSIVAQGAGLAAATTSGVNSSTAVNGSLFGHAGFYSTQLDVIQASSSLSGPFSLAGTAFVAGQTVTQTQFVVRGSREVHRFDMPWAHYHLDAGLRYTLSKVSFDNAGVATVRNTGYLSPELILHGMHAFDDTFALHTRTSIALNGATADREVTFEFAGSLNYHLFDTDQGTHDASMGLRITSTQLAFTDTVTAQETTIKNVSVGPEFTYAIRW